MATTVVFKPTSLETAFMAVMPVAPADSRQPVSELRRSLNDMPFNQAYDLLRSRAVDCILIGRVDYAIRAISDTDTLLMRAGAESSITLNLHAALMQIMTALQIQEEKFDQATITAAATLSLLAQQPKRKDEPFLTVLGALLYDIAHLHELKREYKQAERELEKSLRIFGRLARGNPERYGSAHIMAQTASTSIYRSRVKQSNLLAHYQVATQTYLKMVNEGITDATIRLAESLYTEGETLMLMGRHREAVNYLTRALKYITKVLPNFDRRQLTMSITLGETLLNIPNMREKGIHLLNTMLHKATKINAESDHRRIVDILYNANSRQLDILSLWHKIFPR